MSSHNGVQTMPLRTDPSHLLEPVVLLAREAGRRIMAIYAAGFDVNHKADASPLTAADLAAHDCLVEGLAELASYPILSEESAAIPFEQRTTWDTYWLVDPLDGTKEFIKRNGEFTVNVALIHRHQPVLGVVVVPASGVAYFAAEGCGAFRQPEAGLPESVRVATPPGQPLRVVGSRSHGSEEMERYLARLGDHERLPVGSSLKFCRVAEGLADLYPRIGLTSEWDTAAAQCVVEQAGGAVVDLAGRPLCYNARASLLNPYFLVYGDKSRDWLQYAAGIVG
jgi:3'(2'), 5'-bisphosphate nucleotidase